MHWSRSSDASSHDGLQPPCSLVDHVSLRSSTTASSPLPLHALIDRVHSHPRRSSDKPPAIASDSLRICNTRSSVCDQLASHPLPSPVIVPATGVDVGTGTGIDMGIGTGIGTGGVHVDESPKICYSPLPSPASHTGSILRQPVVPSLATFPSSCSCSCSSTSPPTSSSLSSACSACRPAGKDTTPYLDDFTRHDFIRVLALYIERQTSSDVSSSVPSIGNPLVSVFFSVCPPKISVLAYVGRLVTDTHCSPSAFVVALVFLQRIAALQPALALSRFNLHRLLIAALTLAVKKLDDCTFSIAHFARVGGVPSTNEMIRLELTFMRFINYQLHLTHVPYIQMMNVLNSLHPIIKNNIKLSLDVSLTTSSIVPVPPTMPLPTDKQKVAVESPRRKRLLSPSSSPSFPSSSSSSLSPSTLSRSSDEPSTHVVSNHLCTTVQKSGSSSSTRFTSSNCKRRRMDPDLGVDCLQPSVDRHVAMASRSKV